MNDTPCLSLRATKLIVLIIRLKLRSHVTAGWRTLLDYTSDELIKLLMDKNICALFSGTKNNEQV